MKIKKIYLTWRTGRGKARTIVGELYKQDNNVEFTYLDEGLNEAKKNGFCGYPGLDIEQKIHRQNVLELFSKRLINMERNDAKGLLDFWEIDETQKNDAYYILAMTQGKMQTDDFEFLASFIPNDDLNFVTEIAGVSYHNFDLSKLNPGDYLDFERETDNPKDRNAIKVLFENEVVGYIKKGHNELFKLSLMKKLKIRVKSITNTTSFKELYVNVFVDQKRTD